MDAGRAQALEFTQQGELAVGNVGVGFFDGEHAVAVADKSHYVAGQPAWQGSDVFFGPRAERDLPRQLDEGGIGRAGGS